MLGYDAVWLEFFTSGLATQLQETVERGRRAIRAGVLATDRELDQRQVTAIEYLQEHASIDIERFESICSGITRRSLQRDLATLIKTGILMSQGEARATRYSLSPKWGYALCSLRERIAVQDIHRRECGESV